MPAYTRPCQAAVSNRRPEYRWLCDPANRGTHAFLNSVHESLHTFGRLTDRQIEAVARIMVQRQVSSSLDDDEDLSEASPISVILENLDEDGEDDEDDEVSIQWPAEGEAPGSYSGPHNIAGRWAGPQTQRAALWNQAQWVYNGEFQVSGSISMKFKIHTIAESRNNPDLVGKRAVSVWQNGRWKAFAFVSVTGQLVPWRAWRGAEWLSLRNFAFVLLESMRADDIPLGFDYTWDHDFAGETWTITRTTILCRRCNRSLATHGSEDMRNGVHDEDCEHLRTSPFNRPRAARSPRLRPPAPVGHAPGIVHPNVPDTAGPRRLAMSELGTDWVQ